LFEEAANGEWLQVAELTADFPHSFDHLGFSVSLDGDTALLGATGVGDRADGTGEGAAYIFRKGSSGIWNQVTILSAEDIAYFDYFGFSVSMSGDLALVGASGPSYIGSGVGSKSFLYRENELGEWQLLSGFTASDTTMHDAFGYAVSLSGSRLVVGASNDNSRGSAYVFRVPEPSSSFLAISNAAWIMTLRRRGKRS
jgi:hypothetical protein